MKGLYFLLILFFSFACKARQKVIASSKKLKAISISLPPEIRDANKQFSGLHISNNVLYMLPECRLKENQEAVIYAIQLKEIDRSLNEQSGTISYTKYPIIGLEQMFDRMRKMGEKYEGLEAIIVNGQSVYLSIETATPSANCFLIKGLIKNHTVELDTSILTPVLKPVTPAGNHIYNAGFEAITSLNNRIYCFYEYNSFQEKNYVYTYDSSLHPFSKDSLEISNVPFRITDIVTLDKNNAAVINFFYNGDGDDAVYRPLPADNINYNLVHDSSGFKSHCRLLNIHIAHNKITYGVLSDIPAEYNAYNWEGIASYKSGYFLVNDKYTAARPYKTVLLYLLPGQ